MSDGLTEMYKEQMRLNAEENEMLNGLGERPSAIRGEILDEAKGYILKDRNSSYDEPERNFDRIALLWQAYLVGRCDADGLFSIEPRDVAIMMALMKVGRLAYNPQNRDSWTDAVGYLACGAESGGGEMKYTKEELTEMAKQALEARAQGDFRFQELILHLALATGIHPEQCVRNIEEMANG